jgi:hypothetical protein
MKKILLSVVIAASALTLNAQSFCSELFFSEIVEGSGNNKAFEVYNPTQSPVNLSNYRIVRYSNGSTVGTDSLTLSGTIGALDVWVIANGQTTTSPSSPACDTVLQNMADQLGGGYPDPCYQNGDDAIVLVRVSPYAIIDIFGKIGEDPGNSWSDVFPYTDAQGAWWTRDHSLQRKPEVTSGMVNNPQAFNVTAEYDSLPEDDWSNLGIHDCNCADVGLTENTTVSKMSVYPNPSNGEFVVNTNENIRHIEVINTLGEVVLVQDYSAAVQQERVDLSGMPGGMYMIQVQLSSGTTLTTKITLR